MVVANVAIPIGFLIAWINLSDENKEFNHVTHDPQTQTLMIFFILLQLITVCFTVGGVQRFASHMSKVINGTLNKVIVGLMIFSQLCFVCLLATFFIFDLNKVSEYIDL